MPARSSRSSFANSTTPFPIVKDHGTPSRSMQPSPRPTQPCSSPSRSCDSAVSLTASNASFLSSTTAGSIAHRRCTIGNMEYAEQFSMYVLEVYRSWSTTDRTEQLPRRQNNVRGPCDHVSPGPAVAFSGLTRCSHYFLRSINGNVSFPATLGRPAKVLQVGAATTHWSSWVAFPLNVL